MRRVLQAAAAAGVLFSAACGQTGQDAAPAPPSAVNTAAWVLNPAASRLSFASVKADTIGEGHRFTDMSGTVGPDGAFTLTIPLDSVETKVPIRNERMRELLFETAAFPNAVLRGQVDLAQFEALAPGERQEGSLSGQLELHGVTAPIEAAVLVTRLDADRVAVETIEPVLIEAGAFQLGGGVEKLRAAANLPSISPVAPVHASLVFAR